MPDAPDDVAALRAENGRLRALLEDKDARIAELEERIARLERPCILREWSARWNGAFQQVNLGAFDGCSAGDHATTRRRRRWFSPGNHA